MALSLNQCVRASTVTLSFLPFHTDSPLKHLIVTNTRHFPLTEATLRLPLRPLIRKAKLPGSRSGRLELYGGPPTEHARTGRPLPPTCRCAAATQARSKHSERYDGYVHWSLKRQVKTTRTTHQVVDNAEAAHCAAKRGEAAVVPGLCREVQSARQLHPRAGLWIGIKRVER